MYIKHKDNKYPCKCRPGKTMVYRELPEDFPAPVEGEISLYADDDFLLRTDNTADYLRQTFADGVLTLTNVPEPEPMPEPEPIEPVASVEERLTTLEESNADMAEALNLILSGVTE